MKTQVLGVKVDDVNADEALKMVHEWLKKGGKHYIVTPNPEIIVAALADVSYRSILNSSDLSLPDGVGLKLSGVKNHIAGVDFMEELIKMSEDWGSTIALLGGAPGVAEKTAECLRSRYPNLNISFADSGGEVNENGEQVASSKTTNYILPAADLLFVAFGPPKQEKWIYKNLEKLDIKVAMGVGGAFDYLSGKVIRAPQILRRLGLEWLFRLIIQPRRIKRQLALVKYWWLQTECGMFKRW